MPDVPLPPAPRLDPITRFLPPIDPWIQQGLAWGDVATGEDGQLLCSTNRPPQKTCDPSGPRPFVHAGFDAKPAADRLVHASAQGRVVSARNTFAPFVGGGPGETGGVVILEHDMDGDPATREDLLQTIYEHVEPLVAAGDIVTQGQPIGRTSIVRGEYLHFGVRRAAFDPSDVDVYRGILPPAGTSGCVPCYGPPLPVPAFPERWQDPADLLRGPSAWAEILGPGQEGGGDVLERADGYIVGGWTRAANIGGDGGTDMWLVKLDLQGRIVSQRALGESGNEEIRRLLQTSDGGFVALAQTSSIYPTQNSPVILKFDATGQHIQWQTRYLAGSNLWANDLRPTSDGGYIMAGTTGECCTIPMRGVLVKLDGGGAVQWTRTYQQPVPVGIFSRMDAISVVPTDDGGYVVAGSVLPGVFGATDLVAFGLDSTGHQIWTSTIGGVIDDVPGQIEESADGGFVIVGRKDINYYFPAVWFLKLHADGTIDKESVYTTGGQDGATRLVRLSDGGFLVAGHAGTLDQHRDLLLLRLDPTGQIVQQQTFDGRSGLDDVTSLHATGDGGFVLSGGQDIGCSSCVLETPPKNLLVVKTDKDLEVSGGCGQVANAVQLSWTSPIFNVRPLIEGDFTLGTSPASLTQADTGARVLACADNAYGPPPVLQAVGAVLNARSVTCDFTQMMESFVCEAGIPETHATLPILFSGSYRELSVLARVTDADSTPDMSDIVDVRASLQSPSTGTFPMPLADDGSTIRTLQSQFSPLGESCFDDPNAGVCYCTVAQYPVASGDALIGDSIYSSVKPLINNISPALLDDCAMMFTHARPFNFSAPSTTLGVSVQATDRIGNVSVWPQPISVTTGLDSVGCSGDACGCCLLVALTQGSGIDLCFGLPGMPSPAFPCGLCVGAETGSCPP